MRNFLLAITQPARQDKPNLLGKGCQMTLRQLHARISEIIADNDKSGFPERNDLVVIVQFFRDTMRKPKNPLVPVRYFPVNECSRSVFLVARRKFMSLAIREREEIEPTKSAVVSRQRG
jgi:hypothetical protein